MRIVVEDGTHPDRVTHLVGYAELQRQIVLNLDELGEEVHIPDCREAIERCSTLARSVRSRLHALARQSWRDDRETVYLHVASPDHMARRPDRFNVALTMTERESLDHYTARFDWVGICNSMDLVITPTEWNRTVFDRHGIRNITVCPLGADTSFFTPAPVRFLTVLRGYGLRGSRANWQDIVAAFEAEFEHDADARLTVISQEPRRSFKYDGWRDALRQFPQDLLERARRGARQGRLVLREAGQLTQEQMRSLYRAHDCYVSYSREGWGLPLLEAMACSLEVVACNYGAPMAYLDGSPALLFDAGRLSADNLKFEGGDLPMLRKHLRAVYDKRRRMRSWATRFGWAAATRKLRDIVRDAHSKWLQKAS